MAKEYSVTLYFETGFSPVDRPSSPSALSGARSINLAAALKRQNLWLSTIQPKITFDDAEGVDYAKVGNKYYYVQAIQMIGELTCQMSLVLDPVMSVGGVGNFKIVSGIMKRGYPKEDKPFDNLLSEDFAPKRPMRIISKSLVHKKEDETRQGYLTVVAANVDLTTVTGYAKKLIIQPQDPPVEGEEDVNTYMLIPELPPANEETTTVTYGGASYEIPSVCLFNFDGGGYGWVSGAIRDAVKNVREIGIENSISAMYVIPVRDIDISYYTRDGSDAQRYPKIKTLSGKTQEVAGDAYKYGTPKHSKAWTLYNKYDVIAVASNDRATFDASDLYRSSDTAPTYVIDVDPSPGGTATIRPKYYQNEATAICEHAVAGMPWLSAGYAYEGGSGSALTMANANRNVGLDKRMAINRMDMYENVAKYKDYGAYAGVIGGAVDAGLQAATMGVSGGWNTPRMAVGAVESMGGIGGIASSHLARKSEAAQMGATVQNDILSTVQNVNNTVFRARADAYVTAPDIQFPVTVTSAAYFGNTFLIAHWGLHPDDQKDLDNKLTRDGWTLYDDYYDGALTNHTYFNPICFEQVLIDADCSMTLRNMIRSVLTSGCRFWHVLPAGHDYNNNPKRGA